MHHELENQRMNRSETEDPSLQFMEMEIDTQKRELLCPMLHSHEDPVLLCFFLILWVKLCSLKEFMRYYA